MLRQWEKALLNCRTVGQFLNFQVKTTYFAKIMKTIIKVGQATYPFPTGLEKVAYVVLGRKSKTHNILQFRLDLFFRLVKELGQHTKQIFTYGRIIKTKPTQPTDEISTQQKSKYVELRKDNKLTFNETRRSMKHCNVITSTFQRVVMYYCFQTPSQNCLVELLYYTKVYISSFPYIS